MLCGVLEWLLNQLNRTLDEVLQGQDTAISSLGKLLSNLSSDMSSLTAFSGTMSQKLGSSSDQGVLTLSAATSAAIAGTHVVTVSNLAQTSSGYLARIKKSF